MDNKKKTKIIVIIGSIILAVIALTTTTYSLFYNEEVAANPEEYSTGLLSITATSKSDTISLSDSLPMTDEDGANSDPYVFTITNNGNVDYNFDIKLLSTTSSNNIDTQYIKIKVDDSSPVALSSLTDSIIKSNITLAAKESIDITLRVWLDENTPNTEIGKTFTSKIVTDGQAVYTESNYDNNDIPAYATLTSLGLSIDTANTPDFSTCSGNVCTLNDEDDNVISYNNGDGTNGIYESIDDLGVTYYFRGAVTNNYVSFANKTWRIVRINGDGTVRIALNESAGTSEYNTNYNDNSYVGYMYGTAGSSTYADTHANTNSSTIKTYLDNWYQTNLSSYGTYIADSIFCNDRSLSSGTGIGSTTTYYAARTRTRIDFAPSLICSQDNDKFTENAELGNGKLTYSIGLLTADEYLMAGAGPYKYNTSEYYAYTSSTGAFYLYDSNHYYWTMSPNYFSGGNAIVSQVNVNGYMYSLGVYRTNSVRPVISLTADAITGGTGTSSDPFTVG